MRLTRNSLISRRSSLPKSFARYDLPTSLARRVY